MTAKEEDILTNKVLLKKGTVISELIKSCLTDKRVDPKDLISGDRNALLVAIRITGYGEQYVAEVQCPECDFKNKTEFNLSSLPITRLEVKPLIEGQNVFQFKLPATGANVHFKFLTGRDEEEILATQEKKKKAGLNSDTSVTTNLAYQIISVNGIDDRAKIAQFVQMMPARDSLALRTYIKDNEPGIEMKQEMCCSSCGHTEEVNVPLGTSFLWPSAS